MASTPSLSTEVRKLRRTLPLSEAAHARIRRELDAWTAEQRAP